MKKLIRIINVLLILLISCTGGKPNKNQSAWTVKGNGISDSTLTPKVDQNNYLIDNSVKQDDGPVYMYCEKMPEFPGGEIAFIEYVKKKLTYPSGAISDKIEGRVTVKFIIRKNGAPSNVQIIKSLRSDVDNECLKVISNMPKWNPGMINGKVVSVSYSIPIRFLLKETEKLNGIYILPESNKLGNK